MCACSPGFLPFSPHANIMLPGVDAALKDLEANIKLQQIQRVSIPGATKWS